ncbi:amino acid permease [candidate division KSB1 bacterium]|nr:amino acid permease [candidate division KSB1 bacterium]
MRESSGHQISTELSRDLSLFHVTMMGVGMMIGAGVFLGIGNAVRVAGPGGVLLTFALNGMLAMFTAMSYAELSSAIPKAGGAYNFARIAFGRGTSFISGWMEWFASSVAGSVYSLTFAIYTLNYLEQLGLLEWLPLTIPLAEKIVAIFIGLIFIYINFRGASETGKAGAFFTLGQMFTLAIIGFAGVYVAITDPSRFSNFKPFLPHGWAKLFVTMGFTYVAFEGYEVIAQAGDETIDPRKNIPKAMLYSVIAVVTTYLLVSFATLVGIKAGAPGINPDGTNTIINVPWEWIGSYGEKEFGVAASKLMPLGGFLVTIAVIFASTSALNATIYSATRTSYALGRDVMLPKSFAKISKRFKTPYIALAFTSIIILCVATFLPTIDVASSASIMFLFLFFLVNVCVIKIRRNVGDELTYGFIMPFFPLFPVLGILFQLALAVGLGHISKIAWIVAPTWIGIGFLIYFSYSKKHAVATVDEIVVLEEEKAEVFDEKYRVLVPVANPANALPLVKNTLKLCSAKDASVELLHMVQVPSQVPLADSDRYMLEGKEAITEVMLYLEPRFPINSTIRYCRNAARGIVSAAREKKIDMVILGWHGKSHRHDFIFGSTVDPVIEKTPCNVVVFKGASDKPYKRVLVPFAGGPNSAIILEIAAILADKPGGEIVPLNIAAPGKPTQDIESFLENTPSLKAFDRNLFKPKYVVSRHIVKTILDESKAYDLVVIGSSRERMLQQMVMGSIPEELARHCTKPLVMVKSTEGIQSFIKRWI